MYFYSVIFITVGTTEFDELIYAIDNDSFLKMVNTLKCKRLIIQIGRGTYSPKYLMENCKQIGIEIEVYNFKPNLQSDMTSSRDIPTRLMSRTRSPLATILNLNWRHRSTGLL